MATVKRASRGLSSTALILGLTALAATVGPSCGTSSTPRPSVSTASTTAEPQRGGALTYGIESDPNGLDPSKNGWDPSGLIAANLIFDPIAKFDANGVPQPYLVESWMHNDTYTEWTFRLRPGIKFHDGSPLNADAVLRFSKAILDSPITGPASVYIERSELIDDLTVRTIMKRPWVSYPVLLTGQGGFIAAPAQLDDPEGSIHPIGTGPFKIERWDIGRRLTLVRNPDYWRPGLPYLDRVELVPTRNLEERVRGLQEGTFDVIHSSDVVTNRRLDELAARGEIVTEHDPGVTEVNFLMFNTAKPPLDDVNVRRALAHATDRDKLISVLGWPEERKSDSPFPPDSPWFVDAPLPSYDKARAEELVKNYQEREGKPLQVTIGSTPDPVNLALMNEIARQWRDVGVDVRVETIEFKDFVILAVAGSYQVVNFRYFGQPDPDALWHFWSGETIRPIGQISLNFTRFDDPEINEGMRTGRESSDPAARREAYRRVLKRFAETVPYIWLYRTDWLIATSPRVHQARSVSLPDGSPAMPFITGVHDLTETWLE